MPATHSRSFSDCSGCGLCLLVCPVWRGTRDPALSPLGRAKALQHGAAAADIAASVEACTLCAACEPACPEEIGLTEMVLHLRAELPKPAWVEQALAPTSKETAGRTAALTVVLPGIALRQRPGMLQRVTRLLDAEAAGDDGLDIALAIEAGAVIPAKRLDGFLDPLRGAQRIAAADGLLARRLRQWLPKASVTGLGEALSRLPEVRRGLRPTDLYVIEPRAYHADYGRLVRYYDGLRVERGCRMNLDLQRIAVPASARSLAHREDDGTQSRWLLLGRSIERIVVECLDDAQALEAASGRPVVHLAELAETGNGKL